MGSENGEEAIESGATFLFKMLYAKDCIGRDETQAIKQVFGPFPSSSATAACDAINRIVSYFTEEQLTALLQSSEELNSDPKLSFGRNIAFSFDMHDLDDFEELLLNGEMDDQKVISLDYEKIFNNQFEHYPNNCGETSDARSSGKVDDTFLWCEVGKYLNDSLQGNTPGPTMEHLCCTLYEMLASHKSGDELQNEVGVHLMFFSVVNITSINRSNLKLESKLFVH